MAYLLYSRLISRIRPARANTLTCMVPAFAMLWAGHSLGEAVTADMLGLGALVLLGTGMAPGALRLPTRRRLANRA